MSACQHSLKPHDTSLTIILPFNQSPTDAKLASLIATLQVRERDLSKALKLNGGRMALAAADQAVVRDDAELLSAVGGP
jgi:hypothetical protein